MIGTAPEQQSAAETTATGQIPRARSPAEGAPDAVPLPDAVQLEQMVAEAAYFIAEHRGFAPGHEIEDWLEAEAQVNDTLAGR